MNTCLRKRCSFCSPCLSFVNVYVYASFRFGFEVGLRDLIVLVCLFTLSFSASCLKCQYRTNAVTAKYKLLQYVFFLLFFFVCLFFFL